MRLILSDMALENADNWGANWHLGNPKMLLSAVIAVLGGESLHGLLNLCESFRNATRYRIVERNGLINSQHCSFIPSG